MTTAFELAQRYVGIRELAGEKDHPLILWWLRLCNVGEPMEHDETPWCSAFVNGICWELRLPRSKSAAARSWLQVGTVLQMSDATPGYDLVILERGQTGGHVGFYAGQSPNTVSLLAGNQGDAVSVASFPRNRILGLRRLRVP